MLSEQIHANGWYQGSTLTGDQLVSLGLVSDAAYKFGIVLTHSCDLRHHDLEAEPYVEVAVAVRTSALDPMCCKSRNPRKLHIEIRESGEINPYEVQASSLRLVPRDQFAKIECTTRSLEGSSFEQILRWRARRFLRVARPNDLKTALDLKKKQIATWLKRANQTVSEMRVRFDPPGELRAGERYQVEILLLSDGNYENVELGGELDRLARSLSEILEACGLSSYGAYDRVTYDFIDTISVRTYDEYLEFDLGDHLSEAPPAIR